jgi:hypothetical protein
MIFLLLPVVKEFHLTLTLHIDCVAQIREELQTSTVALSQLQGKARVVDQR